MPMFFISDDIFLILLLLFASGNKDYYYHRHITNVIGTIIVCFSVTMSHSLSVRVFFSVCIDLFSCLQLCSRRLITIY